MDINRLRWACRRGMLEVDLVLLPFLENEYASLPDAQKVLFERLLECEDQDLFSWFLKKSDPEDPEIKEIVAIVNSKTGLKVE
ncbi:succinate dehydrogenase assembly factor 2 [Teredinibacter sp. KSP-S5-2]|uniref:FAD assembly factor SdhE n=1 Tax=Teredinibacter sp. KSP-S5-2 TaxID=3034506 RepID=UPI002934954A|nr:succinate dehydrogenase assembly factor 2 [Teredinibacter sp. KSP-S5-2]WNO08024.1 succinate dehydrogenase assembly factor 2 [Teredinibacter sp. KSP-S5-2]